MWEQLQAHAEAIIAFAALIISGCAFFLTVYQGQQTRKHNKLSVRPNLNFHRNIESIPENKIQLSFSVNNAGIGPAIIKTCDCFYDGKLIPHDEVKKKLPSYFQDQLKIQGELFHSIPQSNYSIPTNEKLYFLD